MRRELLSILCGVVLLAAACGDGDSQSSAEPTGDDTVVSELRPFWNPAVAAVGSRVFMWGGTSSDFDEVPLDDGALFNPASETFEVIDSSPFTDPLRTPSAAAVGQRVVVIGVACALDAGSTGADGGPAFACEPGRLAAAVYDVAAAEWSPVELPADLAALGPIDPAALLYPRAVAVGSLDSRVVFDAGPGFGDYWTLDVDAGEWTRLPDPPVQIDEDAHAQGQSTGGFDPCVAGSKLLVAESANPVSLDFARPKPDGIKVHALDLSQPQSQWATSESLTYDQVPVPEMSCSPDGALIYSSLPGGGSRWLDAADLTMNTPGPQPETSPDALVVSAMTWTGDEFIGGLTRGGEVWSFDSSTLQWQSVDPHPGGLQIPRRTVGVDGRLVFIAEGSDPSADGEEPGGHALPGTVATYDPQP